MKLVDIRNIMALVDEEKLKTMFKEKFDKLKLVESWATHGLPSTVNDSDLWPVIDGKVLALSYSHACVFSIMALLNTLGREYTIHVLPEMSMPLVIKIKWYYSDTDHGYFLVAPREVPITDEAGLSLRNEHED